MSSPPPPPHKVTMAETVIRQSGRTWHIVSYRHYYGYQINIQLKLCIMHALQIFAAKGWETSWMFLPFLLSCVLLFLASSWLGWSMRVVCLPGHQLCSFPSNNFYIFLFYILRYFYISIFSLYIFIYIYIYLWGFVCSATSYEAYPKTISIFSHFYVLYS